MVKSEREETASSLSECFVAMKQAPMLKAKTFPSSAACFEIRCRLSTLTVRKNP